MKIVAEKSISSDPDHSPQETSVVVYFLMAGIRDDNSDLMGKPEENKHKFSYLI